MDRRTLKAPAAQSENDRRPGVKRMTQADIMDWALDDNGGGLPRVSATPFARWLESAQYEYAQDSEAELTNESILEGAREHWCGQS